MTPSLHEFRSLATAFSSSSWTEPVPAVDAAAWFLIALLFGLLTGFLLFAAFIRRQSALHPPSDEPSVPAGNGQGNEASRQPWEKDADWWKSKS